MLLFGFFYSESAAFNIEYKLRNGQFHECPFLETSFDIGKHSPRKSNYKYAGGGPSAESNCYVVVFQTTVCEFCNFVIIELIITHLLILAEVVLTRFCKQFFSDAELCSCLQKQYFREIRREHFVFLLPNL